MLHDLHSWTLIVEKFIINESQKCDCCFDQPRYLCLKSQCLIVNINRRKRNIVVQKRIFLSSDSPSYKKGKTNSVEENGRYPDLDRLLFENVSDIF
ncbi:Pregnancy zone protein [Dirofilaria immitis]